MKPPYAIGSVPSLSGHAIAYRWRSLPRVRQHRASKPQGSSERVLPWQITMDQLIFASLSHTHYWYEVGMLKVPAVVCMCVLHINRSVRGRETSRTKQQQRTGHASLLSESTICFGTFLCARQTVIVYRCNSYQSYPLTHSTSRSGECIKQRTVEGSKYTYRSRSEHLPDFSSVLSVPLQKERGSVGVGCNLSKSRHSAIYMRTTVFPLSGRLIVTRAKSVHSNTFSSFFFL